MFKNFISLGFLFFISCTGRAYSQSPADTAFSVKQADSSVLDSSINLRDSSAANLEEIAPVSYEDSLYVPVRDSIYPLAYTRRQVSESTLKHYRSDEDYAYANDPDYWKKNKTEDQSGSFSLFHFFRKKFVQWILFLFIIGVILYGIYQLAKENNFKWLSRNSDQRSPEVTRPGKEQPPAYDEAIGKYQAEGNYRMAVRNMYLRLIYTVNSKKIVHIGDSFTNSEMMRAFGSHPQAAEFRFLATAYEYVYYGEFMITKEIFDELKKRFDFFQQKLSV